MERGAAWGEDFSSVEIAKDSLRNVCNCLFGAGKRLLLSLFECAKLIKGWDVDDDSKQWDQGSAWHRRGIGGSGLQR